MVSTSIKCQDFSLLLFRIRTSHFGKGIPVSYFRKEVSLSNHLFFLHHVFSELPPPIHLLAQCSSISARKKQQKAKKTQSGILSIPILDSFMVTMITTLQCNDNHDNESESNERVNLSDPQELAEVWLTIVPSHLLCPPPFTTVHYRLPSSPRHYYQKHHFG